MVNTETWHLEEQVKQLVKQLDAANTSLSTRFHIDLDKFDIFIELLSKVDNKDALRQLLLSCSFPLDQREMAKKVCKLLDEIK